ncbi:MAG: hypothetical protein IIC74_12110 [Bacteroidetes bacterium]|nr:hypothetical protein [Bacteroidota bacterium]
MLPAEKSAELKAWIAERVLTEDENVPWMTVSKAMRETDDLLAVATDEDARLLGEVKDFVYKLADRHAGPMPANPRAAWLLPSLRFPTDDRLATIAA